MAWWAVAVRGIAAVAFGLLSLLLPELTLAVLIALFGVYAIVEGVFNVVAAAGRRRSDRPWWTLLLEGLVSIGAGVVTFLLPAVTALVLAYIIASWAVLIGVFEIAAAMRLRERITGEWWLGLAGALSILFGVILMAAPGEGAPALVLFIGAYALVFGGTLLGLAFRLRRWQRAERPAAVSRAA